MLHWKKRVSLPRSWRLSLAALCGWLSLVAQDQTPDTADAPSIAAEAQLLQKTVGLTIQDKTFFTDRIAGAFIYFDTMVEAPDYWTRESDSCSVIEINVVETPDSDKHKSFAALSFLPKKTGIVTLPVLEFRSETVEYRTEPEQVIVSKLTRSPAMSLELLPSRKEVYVGEPVRFDLTWNCDLSAGALKALQFYPSFFQDSDIEVVVPRSTDPEELQMGMPIGGRRVIARRNKNPDNAKALGRITLSFYLRFSEPGPVILPETRLECALIKNAKSDFGRYAAHFNNSLFEAAETTEYFERFYTTEAPIEIEVLPLPEGEGAAFSGLFKPLQVEVALRPTEVEIGELVELEIKLNSDAPHGMLDLPTLSQQPGLRERFLVDDNYRQLWHENGTTFLTRLRVLSTSVRALPSLQLNVFDPEIGAYEMLATEAIPLQVEASNGQEFISLASFEGAAVVLSDQSEGIWHNMETNSMNDLLNMLYRFVSLGFWPLLMLGPVAFILLLPLVRDRCRRALDLGYRRRMQAYNQFKKLSPGSREKWAAFLRLMAMIFEVGEKAWTSRDSENSLHRIGASEDDLKSLLAMHQAADAEEFGQNGSKAQFSDLDGLAKRIRQLAAKALLSFLFIGLLLPQGARAGEWSEAEQLFQRAQAAEAGSAVAKSLYKDAALKAEAAAIAHTHPGEAWYNAGNAWFQSGYIGRAILAYRNALDYMPFDTRIADNLAAVRAMTLNDVPSEQSWWQKLPTRWLKVAVILLNLSFWALLLLAFRYRQRVWYFASVLSGALLFFVSVFLIQKSLSAEFQGAVVVDAVYGKKGPGYAYANAFNEPLHDGLEFTLVEQRNDWGLIEIADSRQCWLPMSQLQLIAR
ncbi:MAG: hypothetical protein AAF065_13040 [Verrucomicrobiota bacterium]